MKTIAAIYTRSMRDKYFHASMSCHRAELATEKGEVRKSKQAESYKVNTVFHVVNQGKQQCPTCWTREGYNALSDLVAAKG